MGIRSNSAFSGSRVRLLRTFQGLTQRELANRMSVSQQFVAFIEGGKKVPSDVHLEMLADVCGVEPTFFGQGAFDEFREEECHFRKRASTPVSVKSRVLSAGTLFGMFVTYLDDRVELPPSDIPEYVATDPESIEQIAEKCRARWALGSDRPISNIVRVLESKAGAIATRIEVEGAKADRVDAFSRTGPRSLVVLGEPKSGSRQAFDCPHELGHLVMHTGVETGDENTERQANRFASAFLMPRAGFIPDFPRMHSFHWEPIFALKKRWRASAAAIVRRAYDLRLLSAFDYQRANKSIMAQGWHHGEPDDWAPYEPETIRAALEFLYESYGVTAAQVCRELGWTSETFRAVTRIEIEDPTLDSNVVVLPRIKRPKTDDHRR